jgi:hypothetical protein
MADRLKLSTALTLIIAHPNALVGRHEWLTDNARAWFWLVEEAQHGRVVVYGDTSDGSRAIPPGYFYPGEPSFDLGYAVMWVYPPRQLPDQFAKPDHFNGASTLGVPVGRIITGLLVDEASLRAALARVPDEGATQMKANNSDEQKLKRWLRSVISASPNRKTASKKELKERWRKEGGTTSNKGFERAWAEIAGEFDVWRRAGSIRRPLK